MHLRKLGWSAPGVCGHRACVRKWVRFSVDGTQCRALAGGRESEEESGWTGGQARSLGPCNQVEENTVLIRAVGCVERHKQRVTWSHLHFRQVTLSRQRLGLWGAGLEAMVSEDFTTTLWFRDQLSSMLALLKRGWLRGRRQSYRRICILCWGNEAQFLRRGDME